MRWALEVGGNEASVGRALRDSGVPRDEVFVTTKFYPAHKDAKVEGERSLERLDVDHVDLYIIHWPRGGATWRGRGWSAPAAAASPAPIVVSMPRASCCPPMGWVRWLRVRATNGLSRYSLRNQWLIACEGAARGITPTYVAGFRAFLRSTGASGR